MEENAPIRTPRATRREGPRWSGESTFGPLPKPRSPLKPSKPCRRPAPRVGPLAITGRPKPSTPSMRTPPRRFAVSEYVNFTPFHDIKEDIDNIIEKLPADFAKLARTDDGSVSERCDTGYGTELSLFLYSPSKRLSGLRPRTVCQPGQRTVSGEHILATPLANSQAIDRQPVQQQQITPLLKRVRRRLKRTISRLVIRVSDDSTDGRSTAKGPGPWPIHKRDISMPLPHIQQPHPVPNGRSFAVLPITNCKRNLSLPVITVSESISSRSPVDITSTLRKPLSSRRGHRRSAIIHKSPRHLPMINEVLGGRSRPQPSYRTQSQVASICEITALHHEIALADAPVAIKAAASLCVMAIAAAADFLVEDDQARRCNKRTTVVKWPVVSSRLWQKR